MNTHQPARIYTDDFFRDSLFTRGENGYEGFRLYRIAGVLEPQIRGI